MSSLLHTVPPTPSPPLFPAPAPCRLPYLLHPVLGRKLQGVRLQRAQGGAAGELGMPCHQAAGWPGVLLPPWHQPPLPQLHCH